MRDYEIVYIFDSALEEPGVESRLERYHALLAGADGGEITAVDHWGKRQLAYPIAKKTSGTYVVAQVTAAPEALPELERQLKLDEGLLRYLIVMNEGQPTAPMSLATPSDRRREEDEDEDEDEEE